MNTRWFPTGALMAGIAVALGAFAAHGLQARVPADLLRVFEIGVRYHMYHALALLGVGLLAERRPSKTLNFAAWLFLAGIALFSGSLYLMTFTGARWLGAVTPLGGLCFIAAWLALAVATMKSHKPDQTH